ncbi:YlcI/YnfO family protein [Mycetohabitans sp. B46]|uniref:YlcI/YnfO family protein n=1 Tax=Mycetohabitans sp. B46 TaxID=2772536 RepID=UPI00307D632B
MSTGRSAIRVKPELRDATESVLGEGEALSSFVEQSIREGIERRRNQSEFITRGIAVWSGENLPPARELLFKRQHRIRRAR